MFFTLSSHSKSFFSFEKLVRKLFTIFLFKLIFLSLKMLLKISFGRKLFESLRKELLAGLSNISNITEELMSISRVSKRIRRKYQRTKQRCFNHQPKSIKNRLKFHSFNGNITISRIGHFYDHERQNASQECNKFL